MAFSVRETLGGLRHIVLRLERRLFAKPADIFIRRFVDRGVPLSIAKDAQGQPMVCSICGYAIAQLELPNEWTGETCSAIGLDSLIGNPRFFRWTQALTAEECKKEIANL